MKNRTSSIFRALKPSETSVLFRNFSRHSRFVLLSKYTILFLAFIMIASLIFMSVGNNEDKRFNLVFSDINIGEDGPSKMLKPRLQGNDSKNQPYNIIADSAVQINQDSVELSKAIADITLSSGAWLSIKADKANANIKLKQVELIGNVNAFYDNGNEMRTERAFIDLNSGTIKGDMPITGQGEKGTIRANSFIVVDHGKKITFNGKVRVKIFN